MATTPYASSLLPGIPPLSLPRVVRYLVFHDQIALLGRFSLLIYIPYLLLTEKGLAIQTMLLFVQI